MINMLNRKKGVELGLNAIVLAAIALVVLVVVIIVFGQKFGLFSGEINKCSSGSGRCVSESECGTEPNGNARLYSDGRIVEYKCATGKCCVSSCIMSGGTCKPSASCTADKVLYAGTCSEGNTCCK